MIRRCFLLTLFFLPLIALHTQTTYSLDSIYGRSPEGDFLGVTYVLEKNPIGLPLAERRYSYRASGDSLEANRYTTLRDYDQNGNLIYLANRYDFSGPDTSYISPQVYRNSYGEQIYRYGSFWGTTSGGWPIRLFSETVDTTIELENNRPKIVHDYKIENGSRLHTEIKEYIRSQTGRVDTIKYYGRYFNGFRLNALVINTYDEAGNRIKSENWSPNAQFPNNGTLSTYDEQNRLTNSRRVSYHGQDTILTSENPQQYGELYIESQYLEYQADTLSYGLRYENFFLADGIVDSIVNYTWDFVVQDWQKTGYSKYYYTPIIPDTKALSPLDLNDNGLPDRFEPYACVYPLTIDCPTADCTITEDPIAAGVYYADGTLSSAGWVSGSGLVVFKAGEKLSLETGFRVDSGSRFSGLIVDCPTTKPVLWSSPMQEKNPWPLFPGEFTTGRYTAPAIRISPNPFQDKINLHIPSHQVPGEKATIRIFDQQGRTLMLRTIDLYQHTNSLDVPATWSNGLYFLEINGDYFQSVHRLIRQ